jgi:ketosteroid isomerase-like protein
MTNDQRLAGALDEQDAIRVVVHFYACLDRGDAPGCAACFTQDGVWVRDAGPVTGRAAIEQAVARRDPSRRTAHTVSNFSFHSESSSQGILHFTLVAFDASIDNPGAVPVGRMAGIRHCIDTMERVGDAWQIRHRTTAPWMRGQ